MRTAISSIKITSQLYYDNEVLKSIIWILFFLLKISLFSLSKKTVKSQYGTFTQSGKPYLGISKQKYDPNVNKQLKNNTKNL